jgi:hypothetical protein
LIPVNLACLGTTLITRHGLYGITIFGVEPYATCIINLGTDRNATYPYRTTPPSQPPMIQKQSSFMYAPMAVLHQIKVQHPFPRAHSPHTPTNTDPLTASYTVHTTLPSASHTVYTTPPSTAPSSISHPACRTLSRHPSPSQ